MYRAPFVSASLSHFVLCFTMMLECWKVKDPYLVVKAVNIPFGFNSLWSILRSFNSRILTLKFL